MIQYEKIELDYQLPIKLLDIYFEDHHTKTAKHYHNSIEILIPVLGKLIVKKFMGCIIRKILISIKDMHVNYSDLHFV